MADKIIAYSPKDDEAHYFNISNDQGTEVVSTLTATYTDGPDSFKYVGTVPGTLPAGYYTFSLHTTDDKFRAQGDFYWDGSDIVRTEAVELDSAAVEAAVAAALAAYDAATGTDVTDAQTAVQNDLAVVDANVDQLLVDVAAVQATANDIEVCCEGNRDILEADEVTNIVGGVGTVEKRLSGTTTVLFTKDVSLGTDCDINSSVTAP